jgi:hypothetical protein
VTDDRNKLDAAVARAAVAAVESRPARLLDSFIARLGPTLGLLAYEQEQARRVAARKKLDELTAALTAVRHALEARTAALAAELAPLEAEMNARRDEWMAACNAFEAKRIANQSAVVPLQNCLAEVVAQLNAAAPGWGANVRQWQPRDDLPQGPLE